MALQQRTVLKKVTKDAHGNIEALWAKEVYDDSITPVQGAGIEGDDDYIPTVSDIVGEPVNHRTTIIAGKEVPSEIQEFLNN